MKIRRIQIESLRAIDRLDLDLAPAEGAPLDIAVLAGPNGCGKTSVLEACLWALRQDSAVPRPIPDQPFRIRLVVEHEGETYEIERTPNSHSVVVRGSERLAVPKKGLPDWLRVRAIYFSSWRSPRLIGSIGLSTAGGKRTPRAQGDALARLKQYLMDLQAASAFGGHRQPDLPSADALFGQIADLWNALYPGRGGRFEGVVADGPGPRRVSGSETGQGNGAPRYDLVLEDRERPYGIGMNDLSSGEIEVLSMIGSFVMDRTGFDLVLVDEPELHLHPAWHRAIMRVLRRAAPGAQILCATHSEHILDAVYSHQRFTLLRESDPRVRLVSHG